MSYRNSQDFLATAEDVNDNTTAVNGTDFTSREINISDWWSQGSITVWFTPAVPAAVAVDFEFQVSSDGGTSWSSAYYVKISEDSNQTQDGSGVVRTTTEVNFFGISHIRLYRIVVGNGAGNCTVMNARIAC